jgi:hypothetical protein
MVRWNETCFNSRQRDLTIGARTGSDVAMRPVVASTAVEILSMFHTLPVIRSEFMVGGRFIT